jgi:hypothetical protein
MRLAATILTLMLFALCAVSLAGCKAAPVVHGGGALAYIDAAMPETSPKGKTLLVKAGGEVRKDESSAVATAAALNAEQQETARLNQALKDERGHWIGGQLRMIGKTVAIVAALAWVGLGLIGAGLPAGGLGSTLIRLLPLGNPFAFIRDRFVKPAAPAAAGV